MLSLFSLPHRLGPNLEWRLWSESNSVVVHVRVAQLVGAEIYHWFTEGFDMPDLQEAKAFLEECT